MASRKEQKEQARAQREAFEREQQAAGQRRRRLYTLGGVLGLAVVVVVVAILISSGGGSDKQGIATGTQADQAVGAVTSLLRGIPQSGDRLGRPDAPVTMQYFGDLQCPVCRSFSLGTLPELIQREVRPGKLQIRYRSLQTATQDPATFAEQQVAALAAGQQQRMWQYTELFYDQQGEEGSGYVDDAFLTHLARQVPGLDIAQWQSARNATALETQLRTDAAAAQKLGASATPTLVLTGPKGTRALSGNVPYADVHKALTAISR